MAKRNYFLWGCLGCGGFLFLIFLVLASGIGYLAYQGMEYGQQIQEMYDQIDTQYQEVDNQLPFTPPENNLLVEDRYLEFLQIRSELTAFSETYLKQFEDIAGEIREKFNSSGIMDKLSGISSIREIVSTAIQLPTEIGSEHVRLLRESEMSNKEYIWFCATALGSLYQSERNQFEAGSEIWTQYRAQLDEVLAKLDDMDVNQHEMNINVSMENFLLKLSDGPFLQENADLVVQHSEVLLSQNHAAILDYFAVQINAIVQDRNRLRQTE